MKYLFAIINKSDYNTVVEITKQLRMPLTLSFSARGTAMPNMLELLGMENTKKRLICAFASEEKTRAFFKRMKREVYVGVPGHGIVAAVPIKSIGGGNTVAYLAGEGENAKFSPEFIAYEMIVVILNEGRTDLVMNAARSAGAAGGTTLHARGTGEKGEQKFMNVSIASEKEVIYILARSEKKAGIMKAILEKAGPGSEAGAVVFSLPVSDVAGFGMFEENE